MITKIQNNYSYNYPVYTCKPKPKQTSFQGIQRLTHMNIGMMPQGFIGHVSLKNVNKGCEEFVGVFKNFDSGLEKYLFKNDKDEIIGEFSLKINKFFDYDAFLYEEDPSHVYLDDLFNYSNPNTPFYKKGLDHYKGIAVRALQIAQRRSDEAQCVGNIKLNSMPEARPIYVDKIGMVSDPEHPRSGMLMIPADKKEPLSRMNGGL